MKFDQSIILYSFIRKIHPSFQNNVESVYAMYSKATFRGNLPMLSTGKEVLTLDDPAPLPLLFDINSSLFTRRWFLKQRKRKLGCKGTTNRCLLSFALQRRKRESSMRYVQSKHGIFRPFFFWSLNVMIRILQAQDVCFTFQMIKACFPP